MLSEATSFFAILRWKELLTSCWSISHCTLINAWNVGHADLRVRYIQPCAKHTVSDLADAGIADTRMNRAAAETQLFQLANEPFKVPGDSGFSLGGLLSPPADKQEEGLWCMNHSAVHSNLSGHSPLAGVVRSYLRHCREESGRRLVHRCYDREDTPSKYWLAFAQKKFLNKTLT